MLHNHPSAKFVSGDGKVDLDGRRSRLVPKYRDLGRAVGAKFVTVGDDGIVHFPLWGFGGPLLSNSYIGVRSVPIDYKGDLRGVKIVGSLDSTALPHEHGKVASGYYVVPVEPEWYLNRFEY